MEAFTLRAPEVRVGGDRQEYSDDLLQVQVRITLSRGLTFASTPQAPTGTTFNANTGVWDIGTLEAGSSNSKELPVAVNLTSDSTDLPLKERCLTAEVIRAVPWFESQRWKRDNDIFTMCLGAGQKVLVTGGDFPLFDFYPCVGVTSYPCTGDNTLELLATTTGARDDIELYGYGPDDQGRPFADYLPPETFTLQVWDRAVNADNEGVWSTKPSFYFRDSLGQRNTGLKDSQKRLPGASWSKAREDLTVTGPGGGNLPGSFTIAFDPEAEIDPIIITDTTKVTGESFDPGYDVAIDLEFGSLGTYILTMDIRATHSTAGLLTDSATYTFHVGPVADLVVRDAGVNMDVASSQHAYSLMAVNNGPQSAAGVQVTLTGVPEGADAFYSEGRYTEQSCQNGLCERKWTIGDLDHKRTRLAAGLTAGPTLTLVTASGNPDPITATIESTEDYEEIINGTTESVAYHDYDEGDNTATVLARAGTATGEGAPGAPRSLSVQRHGGIAVLSWGEVARLHGHPVTHYHVERNGVILMDDVMDDVYVDLQDVNQPHRTYRVRAVNQFGVPGPWSLAAGGAMAEGPGAPTGLTATPSSVVGRIVLSWFAPSADTGLRYRIEHSRDGSDPWQVLSATHSGLTYTHDGLPPAATQYYRVATVKDRVSSAWVYAQATTKTEPGALAGLTATAGYGVGRIDLAWFPPFAVGGLRYRIEHATSSSGPWTVLSSSYNGLTYSHHGLSPGTTHYYRVAAVQDGVISAWTYVHETTHAQPVLDDQGNTVHVVHFAPLWPENLRFSSVDRASVTLVWDPPANDGGTPVTGYEYRVFGPCTSGADAICDIVAPTRVSGTSVRISGLNREGTYEFQVRALNAAGAGDWSQSMQKSVGPATAGGGRVILSPSRLTVPEGGQATYRVKLSRSPTQPVWVVMHWDGDEDLGGELPFQQFKTLLPSGYDTSGIGDDPCPDDIPRYDWDTMAYAWNVGIPITVMAAEDDDSENGRMTIQHSIYTVPAACLGNPEGYAYDPVYDDMFGIALEVTERDND